MNLLIRILKIVTDAANAGATQFRITRTGASDPFKLETAIDWTDKEGSWKYVKWDENYNVVLGPPSLSDLESMELAGNKAIRMEGI